MNFRRLQWSFVDEECAHLFKRNQSFISFYINDNLHLHLDDDLNYTVKKMITFLFPSTQSNCWMSTSSNSPSPPPEAFWVSMLFLLLWWHTQIQRSGSLLRDFINLLLVSLLRRGDLSDQQNSNQVKSLINNLVLLLQQKPIVQNHILHFQSSWIKRGYINQRKYKNGSISKRDVLGKSLVHFLALNWSSPQ